MGHISLSTLREVVCHKYTMFAGSCGHEQNQSGFNHGERVKEEAMALLTYFLLLLLVCEEPESLFFFFASLKSIGT